MMHGDTNSKSDNYKSLKLLFIFTEMFCKHRKNRPVSRSAAIIPSQPKPYNSDTKRECSSGDY